MRLPVTLRRRASALLALAAVAVTSTRAIAAPAPEDDIRDIHGLIPIPPWWLLPLEIALASLGVVAIALFVRFWRSRPERALSPLERARRALALAEGHARAGRAHEWAEVIAETTRGALASRLGTDVLPQTTHELAKAAWTKPPLAGELDAPHILELLETCDLARFAKASLDPSALLASTALARELTERLFAPPPRRAADAAAHGQTVTP